MGKESDSGQATLASKGTRDQPGEGNDQGKQVSDGVIMRIWSPCSPPATLM